MGRVITPSMKHIRHTSVTVEEYLWDRLAKARTLTPATFCRTHLTNYHNDSYGPYVQQSNNERHSADSSNDKTLSIEPEQDSVGMNNTTVPRNEKKSGRDREINKAIKHGKCYKILPPRAVSTIRKFKINKRRISTSSRTKSSRLTNKNNLTYIKI